MNAKLSFARLCLLPLLLLCSAPATPAAAQTGGTLQGTVLDDQGLALPGATVTFTNIETGWTRSDVTDAQGRYRAPALPPGRVLDQSRAAGLHRPRCATACRSRSARSSPST